MLVAIAVGWSLASGPESNILTPAWFQDMLDRLRVTEHRLLPSWWLSAGLLEAARRNLRESMLFLALMISNALFFRQLAIWTAGRLVPQRRTAACTAAPRRRRSAKASWIDRPRVPPASVRLAARVRLLDRQGLPPLPPRSGAVVAVPDLLGLLGPVLPQHPPLHLRRHYVGWVNMVSFLNVSVVGLLFSTFTTRFIFPMISLEGRRFWILGLLPIDREPSYGASSSSPSVARSCRRRC